MKDSLPNFIKVFSKESLPLDGYQVLFFTYDNGITDDVIKVISDVYCEIYLESVYSKLKLPTLWCRLKIEFDNGSSAKDFYKKIRGIGIEKMVNHIKITGSTVIVECF